MIVLLILLVLFVEIRATVDKVSDPDLAHDILRPQFHFLPAGNWMNDPCAPIFFDNNFHIFYQYNPDNATWGDMHWKHAISSDLVHWNHLPILLSPTKNFYDEIGVFTGS